MEINGGVNKMIIDVLNRTNEDKNDYWNSNWLYTEIKIDVLGFKGFYDTNLRTDDFILFVEGLEKLRSGDSKEVEFNTLEEGIYLKGILEMTGNVQWEGVAKPSDGNNVLTFKIETDNASIDKLINEAKIISNEYPLIGNPE